MKFSMIRPENGDFLIEVTTRAGLTVRVPCFPESIIFFFTCKVHVLV